MNRKKINEWVEAIIIGFITLIVVLGVGATIYAAGYFVSQIWLAGTVDQYPLLSDIFIAGTNVNIAMGALTLINVILIPGIVLLIFKLIRAIKYFFKK